MYKITKPVKLIELFAGIGSQAKALENLGVNFERYRVVEFDKYAIKSYNAVHKEDFPVLDITEIHGKDLGINKTDAYEYILTYSFPCQDLSNAGKQGGMGKGTGTRSGLLWEVERLLNECDELPQVLLMENVPQVHSEKNMEDFNKWCEALESMGYNNFWNDLNAKDYGIPQNRKRCFMVSILNGEYEFPKPFKLEKRLVDLLEEEVEDKFYLSEKCINGFIKHNEKHKEKGTGFIWEPTDVNGYAKCLRANSALCPTDNTILQPCIVSNYGKNIDHTCEIANTLMARDYKGFGNQSMNAVVVREATKKGYAEAYEGDAINFERPNSKTRRGRVGKQVAHTLQTTCNQCVVVKDELRIRKLTPLECWRLMGFSDEDFYKAQEVNSNTQLYKQAGNSIVVNVLEEIFKQMF